MAFKTDDERALVLKAAEYQLTANLATDPAKREKYVKLAEEIRVLLEESQNLRRTG